MESATKWTLSHVSAKCEFSLQIEQIFISYLSNPNSILSFIKWNFSFSEGCPSIILKKSFLKIFRTVQWFLHFTEEIGAYPEKNEIYPKDIFLPISATFVSLKPS